MIVLLILNHTRTKRLIGRGFVRSRYQAAENVILLDAVITLVDITFESLFSVLPIFEPEKCTTPNYITLFTVSQMRRIRHEGGQCTNLRRVLQQSTLNVGQIAALIRQGYKELTRWRLAADRYDTLYSRRNGSRVME
ncbi:hypothetical protein KIN20_032818 [Parelaphostrongylus tenuis]|uniref:Uncharacterized protein n=1 Tax=Parelaphostrongylus tenuis TaxID=148309 RepID=A0AAD5R7H4_PARTN|nr:hypothetical protein KIN20_032818 [Parelaphostrongylus tenuis]